MGGCFQPIIGGQRRKMKKETEGARSLLKHGRAGKTGEEEKGGSRSQSRCRFGRGGKGEGNSVGRGKTNHLLLGRGTRGGYGDQKKGEEGNNCWYQVALLCVGEENEVSERGGTERNVKVSPFTCSVARGKKKSPVREKVPKKRRGPGGKWWRVERKRGESGIE